MKRTLWRLWGLVVAGVGVALIAWLGVLAPFAYSLTCTSDAPETLRCVGVVHTLAGDSTALVEAAAVSDVALGDSPHKGSSTYYVVARTASASVRLSPFDTAVREEAVRDVQTVRGLVLEQVPGTVTLAGERSVAWPLGFGLLAVAAGVALMAGLLPPNRRPAPAGRRRAR